MHVGFVGGGAEHGAVEDVLALFVELRRGGGVESFSSCRVPHDGLVPRLVEHEDAAVAAAEQDPLAGDPLVDRQEEALPRDAVGESWMERKRPRRRGSPWWAR
jgi:hypothetical protein